MLVTDSNTLTLETSGGGEEYCRRLSVEISPEMERAGVRRLLELLEAQTSSGYVVSEVYSAMEVARQAPSRS